MLAPSLQGDFLSDDYGYLSHFSRQPTAHFFGLFAADVSSGIWGHPLDELRPLFAMSYRLSYALFGADPVGHHAVNVLLHLAVAGLLVAVGLTLARGALAPALLAGVLFAAGPGQAEVVSWITGRVDSLPAVFYLLALLGFARWRRGAGRLAYGLAVTAFAAALASKEIALTLPAVLVLHDLVFPPEAGRRSPAALLRAHAPFVLLAAGWLVLRRLVFGSALREHRFGAALLAKVAGEQDDNLRTLLQPLPLPYDLAAVLLAAAAFITLAIVVRSARRPAVASPTARLVLFWGGFYVITLAPLAVTYWSSRHLYLPSAGVYSALALAVFPLRAEGGARVGPLRVAAGAALALVFAHGLRERNAEWVRLGRVAREARTGIAREAARIPEGSTVVVAGIPVERDRIHVFRYALPFAVAPPFVERDVAAALRIVEPPALYCCPLARWWRDRRPIVLDLVDPAGGPDAVLYLLQWSGPRVGITSRRRDVPRQELRRRVEEALRGPPETLPEVGPERAARLFDALLVTARERPGRPAS